MTLPTVPKKFLLFDEELEYERRAALEDPPEGWYRASGDCLCPVCGQEYRKHPLHDPHIWLHVLCNDTCVKL